MQIFLRVLYLGISNSQTLSKLIIKNHKLGLKCISFLYYMKTQLNIMISLHTQHRLYKPVSDWLEMLPLDSTGLNM